MENKNKTVDGYLFYNSEDVKRAKKEEITINKIKETTDVNDTVQLYEMYNKLVSKSYFSTPVGLGFVHELREYLTQFYAEEELKPVPVKPIVIEKRTLSSEFSIEKYDKIKKENDKLKNIKQKLVIAIVAMTVIILGMIFIVITNENLGYFNAEDKVLNKYSAWEERLSNWEDELIKREEMLGE